MPRLALVAWQFSSLVVSAFLSLRGAKRRGSPDFVEVAIGVVFDWIATRPPVARKDAEWVFLLHWIAALPTVARKDEVRSMGL